MILETCSMLVTRQIDVPADRTDGSERKVELSGITSFGVSKTEVYETLGRRRASQIGNSCYNLGGDCANSCEDISPGEEEGDDHFEYWPGRCHREP